MSIEYKLSTGCQQAPLHPGGSAGSANAELTRHDKIHEFHMYDDAGHAFFAVDRPSYRPHAANDGWERVIDWFQEHLQV